MKIRKGLLFLFFCMFFGLGFTQKDESKIKLSKSEKQLVKQGLWQQILLDLKTHDAQNFKLEIKNNITAFSCEIDIAVHEEIYEIYRTYYKHKGYLIYEQLEPQDTTRIVRLIVLKSNNYMDLFKYHGIFEKATEEQLAKIKAFTEQYSPYFRIYRVDRGSWGSCFLFYFESPIFPSAAYFLARDIYELSDYRKNELSMDELLRQIEELLIAPGEFILGWE